LSSDFLTLVELKYIQWLSVLHAEVFFFPGNGTRKLVDGAVMMVPENLLASS
jgi:hypothetical protein